MMKIVLGLVLIAMCLDVPCILSMSIGHLPVYDFLSDSEGGAVMDGMDKRGSHEVDAWSICPPHMTEVDCFYAYLRVYARLRKAAEKSDRVSMRNIGKRSLPAGLDSETGSGSVGLRRLLELCPDDMTPASCYEAARNVYRRVLASLNRAGLK